MLKTKKIYRAGHEFQVPENNMCPLRFKGDAPDEPERPKINEMGQELQDELFPIIERGLGGGGLFPNLQNRSIRDMLAATTEEFHKTQRDLPGQLTRTIPKADFAVRDFLTKSVDAQFARTKEGIRDEFADREFEDKGIAQNLAFSALATEKEVGSQITDLYNQSALSRSQSPDFASSLAGGLGGAAGIMLGGYGGANTNDAGGLSARWQPITATPTQVKSSLFTPTGASALSNQWTNPNNPAISYSRGFSSIP